MRPEVVYKVVPDSKGNNRSLMCYKTGMIKRRLLATLVLLACSSGGWTTVHAQSGTTTNPVVRIDTAVGTFSIELFESTTPITVANFLRYVEDGDYKRIVFPSCCPRFLFCREAGLGYPMAL